MPSTLILATRFYSPPLPSRYVSRNRLLERLSAALQRPVTLISATAGFGKSFLVSEWIQKQPSLNATWLSLEESDNDWANFFRYLVTAWQRIFPQAGESALAEMAATASSNKETLTISLLNDLLVAQGSDRTEHALVVLDDFHRIESQEIQQTVTFLCEHLPQRCHLALIARSDPPLPLARWRSHGALFELRADDLRFTPDEAREFLNQVMGLNLSGAQIEVLETRTEGWVVGLQMAALALQEHALQGRRDTQAFVDAFGGSQRYVLDYLMEEVINQQPEDVQQFLLSTSLLKRFCAPLCNALFHSTPPYSQQILERLGKANLFLIPLDDQCCWYRYHHLFADLLQNRLQQRLPERVQAIYADASQWCAQNGLWQEAIQYALMLKDYDLVEQLFKQAFIDGGINFLYSGMRFLVSSVPTACLAGHPCLSLAKAIEMIEHAQMAGIEKLLNSAEADLEAQPPFPGQEVILSMICLIQANTATIIGDEQWIISASQKVMQLLPAESQINIDALLQLGVAAYYTGDLNQTVVCWEQVLNLSQEHGYVHHFLGCLSNLVRICCHRGELNRAETYYHRGQAFLAQESRSYPRWSATLQRDYADLLRERNRLEEAHERMAACLPQLEMWDLSGGYGLGLLHMARILTAQGEVSGAEGMLSRVEELCQSHTVFPDMRTLVHLFRVRLILASGDTRGAWQELEACQNSAYCQHEFHQEWVLIARARILSLSGRPDKALSLLEGRLEPAKESGRGRNWLEMGLLSALAFKATGDNQKAFMILEEGLAFASNEGFVRIFIDEGEKMRELLLQFRAQYPKTSYEVYLAELLRAFPVAESGEGRIPLKQAGLVEPLTKRELEIMSLVCEGYSNQEIADRLVLSIGTVKNHIHNIFGKLEVSNRPQAIAKAEKLNLHALSS